MRQSSCTDPQVRDRPCVRHHALIGRRRVGLGLGTQARAPAAPRFCRLLEEVERCSGLVPGSPSAQPPGSGAVRAVRALAARAPVRPLPPAPPAPPLGVSGEEVPIRAGPPGVPPPGVPSPPNAAGPVRLCERRVPLPLPPAESARELPPGAGPALPARGPCVKPENANLGPPSGAPRGGNSAAARPLVACSRTGALAQVPRCAPRLAAAAQEAGSAAWSAASGAPCAGVSSPGPPNSCCMSSGGRSPAASSPPDSGDPCTDLRTRARQPLASVCGL